MRIVFRYLALLILIFSAFSCNLPFGKKGAATPIERFTQQQFILWDYLLDVTDLPSHFDTLTTLCVERHIQRVVLYIKNPSAFPFFDHVDTSPNSFIGKANALAKSMSTVVPTFELALLFDTSSFSSSAPEGAIPRVNKPPSGVLSGYFVGLQEMLDWAKAVIPQVDCIKEITFDPEAHGATLSIQQLVYNYADEYKYLNGLDTIRLGTTLGIDESKPTYANISSFPVSHIYSGQISTFPANPHPTWSRGANQESPLLQSVYIQCYQTNIPSLFAAGYSTTTGSHSGAQAASDFNSLLRDTPYVNGIGSISFTRHANPVQGSGTHFRSLSNPILYAYDSQIQQTNKIGVVETIKSDTNLSLGDPGAAFSGSNLSFTRTETTTAWNTQLGLTQGMVDSIYWMFSVNYSSPNFYFGNWQLSDFMDFINQTQVLNNAKETAVFKTGNGETLPIPSKNYALYQYRFATTTVQTAPTSNGKPAPWNLLPSQ